MKSDCSASYKFENVRFVLLYFNYLALLRNYGKYVLGMRYVLLLSTKFVWKVFRFGIYIYIYIYIYIKLKSRCEKKVFK